MTSALTIAKDTDEPGPDVPGGLPLPGDLDRWLRGREPELIATRRYLHAHPELSGCEFETAALVARELTAAGLAPRFLPRGNGVICDIPGSRRSRSNAGGVSDAAGSFDNDRVIALRADIDALPLPDTKDVPYRSTVEGACHACGHDVHTTVLLGTAQALVRLARQGDLPGRVRLLFQPSEETFPSGAPQVIAAGGLKDVTSIFALHCAPQLPVGWIGVRAGALTAAADMVTVTLRGKGGHTARPHLTADLVHAMGRVIVDVPALLDRRVDPRAGVSMVWGSAKAGEAANAIPIEGVLRGTVRVLDRDAWRDVPMLVEALVRDVISGTGAEVSVEYTRGVPPVVNDRLATAVISNAASVAVGPEHVIEAEISMGGEDFSFYLEQVPGAMIRLGVGVPGRPVPFDLHQSAFDVDERAIGYGVRVMTHTALAALAAPPY